MRVGSRCWAVLCICACSSDRPTFGAAEQTSVDTQTTGNGTTSDPDGGTQTSGGTNASGTTGSPNTEGTEPDDTTSEQSADTSDEDTSDEDTSDEDTSDTAGEQTTEDATCTPAARDCASAEDNDCNGAPDNTPDDSCKCDPEAAPRDCDAHEDHDGFGPCKAGTQTCETNDDGSASWWGDCLDAVGPEIADLCSALEDDSNCNGEPNDGCDCTEDIDCDDEIECTEDSCDEDGMCARSVTSGSCLIDGACVAHNAPDPDNPCRYCDATLNQTGWTNASAITACDDGVYCNGNDTCNGSGTCQHQFANGNRCSEGGPCALTTCDEDRDSCFEPDTQVCDTNTEQRCVSVVCGGSSQTVEILTKCTGSSAACNGETEEQVQDTQTCQTDESCNEDDGACEETLGCGTTYCDEATNRCWTVAYEASLSHDEGVLHCNTLDLGARTDWYLPEIDDLIDLSRGCNGVNGTAGSTSQRSTCVAFDYATYSNCTACPADDGPTNGCYTPAGLDYCESPSRFLSDPGTGRSAEYFDFSFRVSNASFNPFSGNVACVVNLVAN